MPAKRGKEYFTISVVSSMFDIHPQTLRLYEREGFLRPERSAGNTRLYSRQDIEHLSTILNLTREMGVNAVSWLPSASVSTPARMKTVRPPLSR